jgi:hypothetical protein
MVPGQESVVLIQGDGKDTPLATPVAGSPEDLLQVTLKGLYLRVVSPGGRSFQTDPVRIGD